MSSTVYNENFIAYRSNWEYWDKNISIFLLRSLKLYNPMEHPITSQKMVVMVFRLFFCK